MQAGVHICAADQAHVFAQTDCLRAWLPVVCAYIENMAVHDHAYVMPARTALMLASMAFTRLCNYHLHSLLHAALDVTRAHQISSFACRV